MNPSLRRNLNRLRNLSPRGVTIIRSLMTLALPIVAVLAMVGMSQVPMASSTSPAARTMMVVVWVGFLWFLGVSLSIMVNRAAEALHSLPHPRPQPARRFPPRPWPPVLSHLRKLQRPLYLEPQWLQIRRGWSLARPPVPQQARLRRLHQPQPAKSLQLKYRASYVLTHMRAYRLTPIRERRLSPHQMNTITHGWE